MFSKLSKLSLAKAAIFKNTPIYVQFYITARCNLTCEQCNIIYANADLKECSIFEIEKLLIILQNWELHNFTYGR